MSHHKATFHFSKKQYDKFRRGEPVLGLPAHDGHHLHKKHYAVSVGLTGEGLSKVLSLHRHHAKHGIMKKMYLHHLAHPKSKHAHMSGKGFGDFLSSVGGAFKSAYNGVSSAVDYTRKNIAPVVGGVASLAGGLLSAIPNPKAQALGLALQGVGGVANAISYHEPPEAQREDNLEDQNNIATVQGSIAAPTNVPHPTPIETIANRAPSYQSTTVHIPTKKIHHKPVKKLLGKRHKKKAIKKSLHGRGIGEFEELGTGDASLPELLLTHPNQLHVSKVKGGELKRVHRHHIARF